MEKTLRTILAFTLIQLLFFSSSGTIFTKTFSENTSPQKLTFQKENKQYSQLFTLNVFAEEAEEEKQDDYLNRLEAVLSGLDFSQNSSITNVIFHQLENDFLSVKAQVFQNLFLIFHCLKIPCN